MFGGSGGDLSSDCDVRRASAALIDWRSCSRATLSCGGCCCWCISAAVAAPGVVGVVGQDGMGGVETSIERLRVGDGIGELNPRNALGGV